jgi:hypothetical protein
MRRLYGAVVDDARSWPSTKIETCVTFSLASTGISNSELAVGSFSGKLTIGGVSKFAVEKVIS